MTDQETASRYARALYASGTTHERWKQDLEAVLQLMNQNPKIQLMVLGPHHQQEKQALLKSIFGTFADEKLVQFLSFLIQKNRIGLLPEIAAAFYEILAKATNTLDTTVVTAVPLAADVQESLKGKLEMTYKKSIAIHNEIDRKMIGGMTLFIGNHMMDGSMKTQLNRLKRKLL